MKEITLFHLTNCPYCIHARHALKELAEENPAYGEIAIHWIEEREEAALAASFDYYYVPTVYYEGKKLYEADPSQGYAEIKNSLKAALDTVLAAL